MMMMMMMMMMMIGVQRLSALPAHTFLVICMQVPVLTPASKVCLNTTTHKHSAGRQAIGNKPSELTQNSAHS